jgi:flagellar biosynthesis protein FlhG
MSQINPNRFDAPFRPRARAAGGPAAEPDRNRAQVVAAASGKGGVGKTNLVANLAVAAASLDARVLLVDGDLGLANVDVLLGLSPEKTVADVLSGACALEQALIDGPRGIRILAAASGRADLAALGERALRRLARLLRLAARRYDLVLVDIGAGVGPTVTGLAAACDRVLVVTNSEPTSLADAYATLKVLHRSLPELPTEVLVNAARNESEAHRTHQSLDRVAQRFLGARIPMRAFLPHDERLARAVAHQRAVVEMYPTAAISKRIVALAQSLLRQKPETSSEATPT